MKWGRVLYTGTSQGVRITVILRSWECFSQKPRTEHDEVYPPLFLYSWAGWRDFLELENGTTGAKGAVADGPFGAEPPINPSYEEMETKSSQRPKWK